MASDRAVHLSEKEYFSVFTGGKGPGALAESAAQLLKKQKKNWPALAAGYAALEKSLTREIDGGKWRVQIQCNPQRMVSSGAKLDPEAIKRRPCFLCPQNLPVEQEAILYRDDYNVLCNPAPIFPGHLTIAAIRHTPQSLSENMELLLMLADDLGPGMTVFYNGPRAGASAPDHLHFQAAPCGFMPIEEEALAPENRSEAKIMDGVEIFRIKGLARGVLVIRGSSDSAVSGAVARISGILGSRITVSAGEPPLNIFCTRTEEGWQLLLFPRLKHRPDAFFREGEQQHVVSPGAADMGGVIITPRERDFDALTAAMVADIYREVAYDDAMVGEILAEL
ncbi:MAG: DUF4922 domain-containing protein [Syntrophobacterales bacterium]|nr:DUF4922 domain-containing protein [Syntrophobacterales bacterium]